MVLTVNLSPELEHRLAEAAAHEGLREADYLLRLLDQHLPPTDQQRALLRLLQGWIDEPQTADDKADGEAVFRALDADRLSDRLLFPEELKGVTW